MLTPTSRYVLFLSTTLLFTGCAGFKQTEDASQLSADKRVIVTEIKYGKNDLKKATSGASYASLRLAYEQPASLTSGGFDAYAGTDVAGSLQAAESGGVLSIVTDRTRTVYLVGVTGTVASGLENRSRVVALRLPFHVDPSQSNCVYAGTFVLSVEPNFSYTAKLEDDFAAVSKKMKTALKGCTLEKQLAVQDSAKR